MLSEEPLLGLGLAEAGRQALARPAGGFHEVDFRISDVTGENYGFKELTLADGRLRASGAAEDDQPLWHAADSIGDTGAAAGVVQLVRARRRGPRAMRRRPRAVCFTSAVPGDRAVALCSQGGPRIAEGDERMGCESTPTATRSPAKPAAAR